MMEQEREVIMQREKRKRERGAFLKHGPPRRDEKERCRVICHVIHQNECFLHDFFRSPLMMECGKFYFFHTYWPMSAICGRVTQG